MDIYVGIILVKTVSTHLFKTWDVLYSAVLAHIVLKENLHALGVLGCMLSMVGSVTMVLHAPRDQNIESVEEIWELATQSGRLLYIFFEISLCIHTYL